MIYAVLARLLVISAAKTPCYHPEVAIASKGSIAQRAEIIVRIVALDVRNIYHLR